MHQAIFKSVNYKLPAYRTKNYSTTHSILKKNARKSVEINNVN